MKIQGKVNSVAIGERVTFDNNRIEEFKAETDIDNKEIQQYRKLVLAGIDEIGVVTEVNENLTTVSYPDGWDLPVPTKYLLVLPSDE